MAVSFPIIATSQSPDPLRCQTQDELISALVKLDIPRGEKKQALLDNNQALVTPAFFDRLMERAAAAYYQQGPEQALLIYGIAIEVATRLKDQRRLANAYYNLARTYAASGKIKDAIQAYLASKKTFEETGRHKDVVYILSDLGSLFLYSQDYQQAKAYSEQSVKLADELKNSDAPAGAWPVEYGAAVANSTLGGVNEFEGNYSEAISLFQKALAMFQELDKGSRKYGFQILDSMAAVGRIYNAAGDNTQALVYLDQALKLSERLPYKDRTASILNSLGMLYLEQEDYEKAAHYFTQGLQINQSLKNQSESARNLLNLGVVDQRRGNQDRAMESFQASLKQATEASNKDVIIAAGEGIGAIHRAKGNLAAALYAVDRSLALAKEIEDQTRIAELLWRKAEVFFTKRDFDEAAVLSAQSLDIARRIRFSNLSHLAATLLGQSYLKQKKYELAFETLARAIEESEQMRGRVVGREQGQQLYFENKVAAYHAMVELSAARNRHLDALLYAERAKARVLQDIMSKGRTDLAKAMTEKEREEEKRLNQTIISLNSQVREERLKQTSDAVRLGHIREQLDSARLQYASFQNLLYASHPVLNAKRGQTLSLTGKFLNDLPQDAQTAFLEYVVTEDHVYLFVLTRNSASQSLDVRVHDIPISQNALAALVNKFHRLTTERNFAFRAAAREFYDLLLKLAEPQLQSKSTICVVPDGILWDAPFQAALSTARRYLIENYAVYYAPSFSTLIEMTKRKKKNSADSLLAFGNPIAGNETIASLRSRQRGESFEPLPEAETEVRKLAQIFGQDRSKMFLGASADEKTFKSLAPGFNTIHFATHGVLDNRNPLYSYLLLAKSDGDDTEDGLIEAREIMNLDLPADLVVLSACDTARGRIGAGEGVIGMSWAFFAAGCRTTVVSQWKVDSAMTAELMVGFYRHLKDGKTKAEALRQAALKLINEGRYEEPIYWAGFVVVGANN
ncbi:MAG: CHAT domain-containing protein [Blastocatellia bacterium]